MSVAVIGPSSFVTCFQLIGASGYEEIEGAKVAETLKKLVDEGEYMLIIIPERFAEETRLIREEIMRKGDITPVFALVPDFTMKTGMRMEELQAVVSLAIGTKLEL
jgi:vacuolar-type H+-ATPase subunit F/Vma7